MVEVERMSKNGLLGALDQYWGIEPKVRLHRRNTFFNDAQLSNYDALKVGIVASVVAIVIIGVWCLNGVML